MVTSPKRKASSTIKTTDYGTRELAKRFTVVPRLTLSNGYTGKVVDDTEIDRLLLNDVIGSDEYSLLVALLHRLHRASFVGLKSPDFTGIGHVADPTRLAERKANAVLTVVHVVKVMDQKMGSVYRAALINLVLLDTPWPYGKASLHDCITALDAALSSQPATTSSLTPQRSRSAARATDR
jgi:hypothetical protein